MLDCKGQKSLSSKTDTRTDENEGNLVTKVLEASSVNLTDYSSVILIKENEPQVKNQTNLLVFT